MTKIAPKLPKSSGLYAINRQLIESPATPQIVVMVVDCKATTTDIDAGYTEATVRILEIEPITDIDTRQLVEQALRQASDRRNGRVALPIDLRTATGLVTGD